MSRYQVIAAFAVLALSPVARADDATTRVTAHPAKQARPYITHANFGVVAMNWTGPMNNTPGKMMTLVDRQTTTQMFGAGRFITPSLRVTLSVSLAEPVGGAPANTPTLAAAAVVPWLGWHPGGPLFLGAGPIISPRIYGKNQLDLGVFTAAGVAFPLGNGFSVGAAVQVPMMLLVRSAISIAPGTFLAYRF